MHIFCVHYAHRGGIKKGWVLITGGINHRVLYGGYGVIWLADFGADFVPVIW